MNAPAPALAGSQLVASREHIRDVWDEIAPLTQQHYAELAHFQDIPLNPDRQSYEIAEAHGSLRTFVLRDAGRLIGYAIFFVARNSHYRDSLQARQDVLFLLPEYRGRRVGMTFIDACDAALRSEGVQAVYQHVKLAHDFGPLLLALGYEAVEKVYARRLDRC